MISTWRLWIVGVLFFLILAAVDGVQFYLFVSQSSRTALTCAERGAELTELCLDMAHMADNSYYRATSIHILIYFVLCGVFLILSSRLNTAEKRISKLEGRVDS